MKRILKYMCLALIMAFAVSCEKNEVEYKTTDIGDVAEFQLHYFVPVTAVATNNINKIEVNDQLYSTTMAPLTTYNAVPNGSVGRFFIANTGSVNIKMYLGAALSLAYDKNVTLNKGKQNVFVYDFTKDPIVFDNGYPYSTNLTMGTDSFCYVKFYNFLFEKAGVPTNLKLQYQYTDPRTKAMVNIGAPVSFGETTGWQPVKVVKSVFISAGSVRVDFSIKVVEADGSVSGDLQLWNTNKVYVKYTGFFTEFIGRRYHHVISGMRSDLPVASVRQFTAL